jgi:inner membrane protein
VLGTFGIKGRGLPRGPLLLATFLALAPDLDFLPGLVVGRPALYHHGISHSLGFALAAAVAAALLVRFEGWSRREVFLLALLAYCSHLALDLVGPDGRAPYGIPLLWPLSEAYLHSPLTLLLGVKHAPETDSSVGEWLAGIFQWINLLAILLEIALVGALALGVRGLSRILRRRAS